MKPTFVLCKDWINYTNEMSNEDRWILLNAIMQYQNWLDPGELPYVIKIVFSHIKNFYIEQDKKYEVIKEKRSESGKKWGRPTTEKAKKAKAFSEKQTKPKQSKQKLTETDTDTITVENKNNKKNNTLTSITKPNGFENIQDENFWSSEINDLILELKETASQIWIAYDAKDERNFWKHICSAREFWAFASKIWQTRIEFSKNIMLASAKIWFWKWVCSWPKSIYQNYVEVYNLTLQKSAKQTKTSIPSFSSWIW